MNHPLSAVLRAMPVIVFVLFYCQATAQSDSAREKSVPVTIRIINQKKEPLGFATVTAIKSTDSLSTSKKTADSSGVAVFQLLKNQQYSILVTSAGYLPYEKGIMIAGDHPTHVLELDAQPKTLGGVTVRSSRPLMRQEDDKTIVDPENLASSSTSGFEVIEKTPGLFVDQDGNIYIASTTPATILINGRETKMSAADVATMLKSLPPNAIQSIEIVRTPSAKYDASGSGGIVNVILKKGVKIGLTGSVTAGIQQGMYGNQFAGLTINNNDGRRSSFFGINYTRRDSYEKIFTDRIFAPDSMLSQQAFTQYPANVYFANYGTTFPVSQKWDGEIGSSISLNDFDNRTNNPGNIKKISTNDLINENINKVSNDGSALNFRGSLTAKLKIDSAGSEWVNDLFYNFTKNKSEQDFATAYLLPFDFVLAGNGASDNYRHYYQAQSDLKLRMKNRLTFETGVKASFLVFNSETDYYRSENGGSVKDSSRTNTFRYDENINSLYAQGSKTFGKDIILKAGARLENTNMRGHQEIPDDTTFSIHRTDIFPYLYLSKKVIVIAGFELRAYLVYRRTITRPVYEQLNPFARYVDQYLSETGNPSLRPQFNNNYEANISVNEMPILAIGVNKTKDIFTNVIYQADTSRSQAFRTYDNLGSNREFYLRGLGAIPPGKKYFFVLGGQYNHNFYEGLYENKPLSFKRGSWTFFTYHSLKIGRLTEITLNGFVRFKGQLQFYELTSFGALNSSINRKFLKEKLVVTLSMNDIFRTLRYDFTLKQGTVDASGFRLGDTRRVGINLRYSFGMRKKEESTNIFNLGSPEKPN